MTSDIERGSEKVIFFFANLVLPTICHLLASVEAVEPGPVVYWIFFLIFLITWITGPHHCAWLLLLVIVLLLSSPCYL